MNQKTSEKKTMRNSLIKGADLLRNACQVSDTQQCTSGNQKAGAADENGKD